MVRDAEQGIMLDVADAQRREVKVRDEILKRNDWDKLTLENE